MHPAHDHRAAATLLTDRAVLAFSVLGGELGVRFLHKMLAVALLAGGIFGDYLLDLRSEEAEA